MRVLGPAELDVDEMRTDLAGERTHLAVGDDVFSPVGGLEAESVFFGMPVTILE